MPALLSVWTGLAALLFAVVNLTLVAFEFRFLVMLIWGIVDALPLTLGIMVIWSYRKADRADADINAQCVQAKVGIALALLALALNCAYLLWYYLTHVKPHLPT